MIALAAGGSAHTSSPSIKTRPPSGRSRPVIIDSEVVFPAPFGPTSPASEPAAMSRSTPATASLAPKLFRSPCTLMPDLPISAFPSAIPPVPGRSRASPPILGGSPASRHPPRPVVD